MNETRVLEIARQLRSASLEERPKLVEQLLATIHEGTTAQAENMLRDALSWEEVKSSPRTVATVARSLRKMRGS